MDQFSIGGLAQQAHVNIETIRYYERTGLIPKPARRANGYRRYTAEHLARVRFIKQSQTLGFSLKEIAELLQLRVRRGATCTDIRRRAEGKIDDINAKIAALQGIRKALRRLVKSCQGSGPTTACPILDALDGNLK